MMIGFTIPPDAAMLDQIRPLLLEDCDIYEVAPETLWRPGPNGALLENGYHRYCQRLRAETGRPFVAHGVALSLGTVDPRDRRRRDRWYERISRDVETLGYAWYTDHLGASILDGRNLALPLPIPPSEDAVVRVRSHLSELASIVPDVGFENTVTYFLHGTPEQDAAFARAVAGPDRWILLDLHNVFTMATNLGFDARDWIAGLDLSRVIEIHVSGGDLAPPEWLGGRSIRLDSHAHGVPPEVWTLLSEVGPRCRALRAVILERMNGTVTDVGALRDEMRRLREITRWTPAPTPLPRDVPLWPPMANPVKFERALADGILAGGAGDLQKIASMLVAKLRFERLLNGSPGAGAAFEADPAAFVRKFKRWHRDVAPRAIFPSEEAATWPD
jgi:uncharacterized protein (UPF0276 family)